MQVAKKDNVVVNHPVLEPTPTPTPEPTPVPTTTPTPTVPTVPATSAEQGKAITKVATLPRTGVSVFSLAVVTGMLLLAGIGLLYRRRSYGEMSPKRRLKLDFATIF